MRRCLAVKLRDRANSAILLAQAPIIALLVVLVFNNGAAEDVTADNWDSVAHATSVTVFLLGLAALWFGCSNAAREIVGEWAIYHRERIAERYFPRDDRRIGAFASGMSLAVMIALLVGAVHAILRSRDVH